MKTKAINYNDYIGTYQEDMAQRFADGELTDMMYKSIKSVI